MASGGGILVASFPGPRLFSVTRKESHRAWYLKSRDQLASLSGSKDGCVSLRFTGDFVSAVSLWHKRAVKISCKKCRFATFTGLCENCNCAHLRCED